jgi:tight adherence protein C
MAILVGLFTFGLLAAAILYYGTRVYLRPGRVYERVAEAPGGGATPGQGATEEGMAVRIIRSIGEYVPASPADTTLTRRYLMAAGFRSEKAVTLYYGLKVLIAGTMLALGLAVHGHVSDSQAIGWVIVGAAGLFGWFAPGLVLEHLVTARQERIRFSLPDALDMIVICVEAGHALDQAFVRVGKELRLTHPDICDELSLVNLEMRAGKRRAEALHNIAERTGERELQKLVAIMIQSDRFGTSIAESLRVHADYMRIRRRQEAEERAGKVGVKLIFPIFFCILPSMFMVTAGPAVIQVLNYLLPALREAGEMSVK